VERERETDRQTEREREMSLSCERQEEVLNLEMIFSSVRINKAIQNKMNYSYESSVNQ
jgi:hypothetical protein